MRSRLPLLVSLCLLFCAGPTLAQGPKLPSIKDLDPKEIKLGEDEPGCKDSGLMPRLTGCNIIQCGTKESDTLELQTGATADGAPQKEVADGASEVIYYLCPGRLTPAQIVKQSDTAFTKAGYKTVFSGKDADDMPVVTVQKDDQYVQISTYTYNNYSAYIFAALKLAPEPPSTSEGMIEQLKARGRFFLDGVNFENSEQTTLPADADKALAELAGALKAAADIKVRVEVHTDNIEGPKTSQEITDKRAAAVVDWLGAHGIAKERLSPQGFGSTKPIADNDTDDGRARNRRIEIIRSAP